MRIAVADKSAYELYLSRTIEHATLMRVQGIDASLELFLSQKLEVLSGLKPRLLMDVEKLPGARLLDGQFTAVQQAIGTPKARETAAAFLAPLRRGREGLGPGRGGDRAERGPRRLGRAPRTRAVDLQALAAGALVVTAGYLIFACTGFGASLITVPVLAHFLPVPFVLAVTVLLDVAASLAVGARFRRDADLGELAWLGPFAVLGNIVGVTLLVGLPRRASLGGLGAFCLAYGFWSLLRGGAARGVSRAWAPVAGLAGGSPARCSAPAARRT